MSFKTRIGNLVTKTWVSKNRFLTRSQNPVFLKTGFSTRSQNMGLKNRFSKTRPKTYGFLWVTKPVFKTGFCPCYIHITYSRTTYVSARLRLKRSPRLKIAPNNYSNFCLFYCSQQLNKQTLA